jgi:A/G-specific adenine glycosylase
MQPANRKRLSSLIADIVPEDQPGAFNQGIMELGETICLPNAQPHCHLCPLNEYCAVAGTERARELPVRKPPKPRRIEKRTVFLIITDSGVVLHRRPKGGLLGGMWEFPNTDRKEPLALLSEWGIIPETVYDAPNARHVFSHIEWQMNGYVVKTNHFPAQEDFVVASKESLADYALPTAFRTYHHELSQWL